MNKLHRLLAIVIGLSALSNCLAQTDSLSIDSLLVISEQLTNIHEEQEHEMYSVSELLPSNISVRSRLSHRLQRARGYFDSSYSGSPLSSLQRLKFSHGRHLAAGLLMEKDAGERRLDDFTIWHISMKDLGIIRNVILGDYFIEAGMGIALWRASGYSKGGEVISPLTRKERGLRPYLSADEQSFFHGIASELQLGSLTGMLFYSSRLLAGSIDSLGQVSTLSTSGFYRTRSEIARKGNLRETVLGFRMRFNVDADLQFGMTVFRSNFSRMLVLDEGDRFRGDRLTIVSADYKWRSNNLSLFGEWGTLSNGIGGISGLLLAPAKVFSCVTSVRYYPPGNFSPHGQGFGEGNGMTNEEGIYLGLSMKPFRKIMLSMYSDRFRNPASSADHPFSSKGNDHLIELKVRPSSRFEITLRFQRKREEEKGRQLTLREFQPQEITERRSEKFRVGLEYQVNPRLRVRARWEMSRIQSGFNQDVGSMVLGDISSNLSSTTKLFMRIIFFGSGSFESRLYESENDLEGTATIPALYGAGARWYVLLRSEISAGITISGKYSETIRDDVKFIGSGNDQLPSNRDNKIAIQIDANF